MMAMMSHENQEIIGKFNVEGSPARDQYTILGGRVLKSEIIASRLGHLVQIEIQLHTLNFCAMESPIRHNILRITVEPVDNSHYWDLRNWLLNTGLLIKIFTGHGLMIWYCTCTSANCGHLESINNMKQPVISILMMDHILNLLTYRMK